MRHIVFKNGASKTLRFCSYTGEYKSVKTRILAYFMQYSDMLQLCEVTIKIS